MPSSFLAEVTEFHATDAYFISDLTTKKNEISKLSRLEN
jgi:hypothetical protein